MLGGIPILRTIKHGLAGDSIEQIRGILNGTTNFILSSMIDSGVDYTKALALAQQAGYAEADPASFLS